MGTPDRPVDTTTRRHAALAVAFTALLIILCQSQQILAYSGISLFLPIIRQDLHLSFSQGGTLAAASTLVYALMQIPSGYLADRFGARALFLCGLVGTSLLSLSFALLHVYWLLVINQAISGVFRALMFAPGLLLISDLFPPARRAMAMGLYVAAALRRISCSISWGRSLLVPWGGARFLSLSHCWGLLLPCSTAASDCPAHVVRLANLSLCGASCFSSASLRCG